MKILFNFLPTLFVYFLFTNISTAETFTSIAGGNFDNPETWEVGGTAIPGESDNVVIKHNVFINLTSKRTIKSLSLSNDAVPIAGLFIKGTDSLVVLNNVQATSTNTNGDLFLKVSGSTTFIIHGNCNFSRVTGNTVNNYLTFTLMNESKTFIEGLFEFDYKGSGAGESVKEVIIQDKALLDVIGETRFTNSAGHDFNLGMYGTSQAFLRDSLSLRLIGTGAEAGITLHDTSSLQILSSAYIFNSSTASDDFAKLRVREESSSLYIQDTVYLESQGAKVKLEAEGTGGTITVGGDINLNASAKCEAYINIIEEGKIYLGGDIIRKTDFGNLIMKDEGALIFNGSNPQTIPQSKLPNSGTDSLFFGKVILENTSPLPFTLTENLIIHDSLVLTNGNLKSDSTAMVILQDSAIISGSSTAYVEGPIMKLGTTAGQNLMVPIGTDAVYAPITISEITSPSSEVTMQYYSEPPPFGVEAFEGGIDNVLDDGYWTVEKNENTGDIDITLTWEDSDDAGIYEVDDLVVVGWNGTEWLNYGQETSGEEGAGGFVTSLYSEPPPFGVEAFTIGSASALNALPVELSEFEAVPESDRVYLKWQTESEINSSHFIVERSIDGIDFKEIESVDSEGSISASTRYFVKDNSPFHGLNYYRLKMVDNDGSYEYSPVEAVYLKDGVSALVYPNPVRDVLFIQVDEWIDEEVRIEIFDMNANRIFESMIYFNTSEFQVPTNNINVSFAGTYVLRITGKTGSKIVKFVKAE